MPKVISPPTSAPAPGAATPPSAVAGVPRTAKRYDDAFKRQAVEHWLRADLPGTQIARELGVSDPTLNEWKRRYHGSATPLAAAPAAQIRALQAELVRVREQRDILKKTLGILSEPSRRATSASKA